MHINTPGQRDVLLGIGDHVFATYGDHIACFWESQDDFAAGVGVLEAGLNQGDHCVVFGHDGANEAVLGVLRSTGIAVDDLLAQGRLVVLGGRENANAMLAEIARTFTRMLDAGACGLRLMGNIGWGMPGWPDESEVLEFERSVTDAVAGLPCIVVCMYDVRSLPPHLIVEGGFALHPCTVVPRAT